MKMKKNINKKELDILQAIDTKTYQNYQYGYDSHNQIQDSSESLFKCQHFENWKSPSDLIIEMVHLKPPVTSKITRAKAHIGIQAIGETYLEIVNNSYCKSILKTLKENDHLWKFILKNEIKTVHKKVKNNFKDIFKQKQTILLEEISSFYEKTLNELEEHVKLDVKIVANTFQNVILDQLIRDIDKILKFEKQNLEKKLKEELNAEINKIKNYYDLLLKNEACKYTFLNNKIIQERNDAVKSLNSHMESTRLTSNMYVLITERKKCKVKKVIVENMQNNEIKKHLNILKKKDDLLRSLETQMETLPALNSHLQEQVLKILRLFLKFMSFSLKLLPEQTTFLLDFEKMVILQLNEFQKQPHNPPQILVSKEEEINTFEFRELQSKPSVCDKNPFNIVGSLKSPFSLFLNYGSQETVGSEADYPYFRVQRKYVYAKCHNFEEIKEMLGADICKYTNKEIESILSPLSNFEIVEEKGFVDSKSSSEKSVQCIGHYLHNVNNIKECPNCEKSMKGYDFLHFQSFLDYNEKNYKQLIASTVLEEPKLIELTNVKDIVFKDVLFPAVEEVFKTVATQCISQDDVGLKSNVCECTKTDKSNSHSKCYKDHDVFLKRKISLKKLLKTNPKLFSILFSDESYD